MLALPLANMESLARTLDEMRWCYTVSCLVMQVTPEYKLGSSADKILKVSRQRAGTLDKTTGWAVVLPRVHGVHWTDHKEVVFPESIKQDSQEPSSLVL